MVHHLQVEVLPEVPGLVLLYLTGIDIIDLILIVVLLPDLDHMAHNRHQPNGKEDGPIHPCIQVIILISVVVGYKSR